MSARVLRSLVALMAAVLVSWSSASAVHAAPPPTPLPPASGEETSTSYADNPFLPEERNLSDCVSAVPKPGCGSEARGGTGQTLVFVALVAGLGLIGWRIVAGLRKQRG